VGIKELDQENAIEEHEENFNLEDLRDYNEVALSLPVYYVSSKAYQKTHGCMKEGRDGWWFQDQIKDRCKQLTEASRVSCRGFSTTLICF